MKIFKLIEVDMDAERKRVNRPRLYTKAQRAALRKLYDLFELGKWQECLNLINDGKSFPRNKKGEYPETEHIAEDVSEILRSLAFDHFWTKDQLLADAATIMREEICG